MENKGYQDGADATGAGPGYQQQAMAADGDDSPPAYPQNPANFEGYGNIGFCNPEQGFHSTLYYSYVIHESN